MLIFRSDRAGAIAKIIYSSSGCSSSAKSDDADADSPTSIEVQATIHVLECKEAYRGLDFGGLLFCEALESLRRTYNCNNTSIIIHCQLFAEEEETRHTRLVRFYEELGCRVRTESKIKFLNNNDGETYRKVPMSIDLACSCSSSVLEEADDEETNSNNWSLSCSDRSCFLPMNLLLDNGRDVRPRKSRRRDRWLLQMSESFNDNPVLQIRTTSGLCLTVDNGATGTCSLVSSATKESSHRRHFQLLRVADCDEFSAEEKSSLNHNVESSQSGGLWLIQSIEYGTFLSLQQQQDHDDRGRAEQDYIFQCQRTASYWKVVSSSSLDYCSGWNLMCTTDTPSLRHHYRCLWKTQCLAYVRHMKTKYLLHSDEEDGCARNRHPLLSLRTALLEHAPTIPADPFVGDCENLHHGLPISLRTLAFECAECVRSQGHPDWVQLVALLYHLGRVRPLLERTKKDDGDDDEYDWSIASRARVLGCPVPEQASYGEFRSLRPTEDAKYESSMDMGMYEPHCGLENVELTWTGPEYMYHMLPRNDIAIPEEGLAMLRLASLSDWHTRNAYTDLESAQDAQVKSLVADLDRMLQSTAARLQRQQGNSGHELSAEACRWLWTSHYADLAAKYNVDGALQW